jgi:hypothetical protein
MDKKDSEQYGVGSMQKERNILIHDTGCMMQDTEICVIASPKGAWQAHLSCHPEIPICHPESATVLGG